MLGKQWQIMFNVSMCEVIHIDKNPVLGQNFVKKQQLGTVKEEKDRNNDN